MGGTALVLGSGGITGVAWELGILHGLAEAGLDLTGADLLVGTSAGSVVAAQLGTGVPLADLYAAQLRDPGGEAAARLGPALLARYLLAMARGRDPRRYGRRMGRLATRARTVPPQRRREVIASRLADHRWPRRRLLVTAVDADSGERIVFDRDSGVDLVDAVTASCAVPGVWPPVPIDGRTYIDGGVRSPANADLARGYGRVVIVAPVAVGAGPVTPVARQAAALGARVAVVVPDAAARRAIGRNVLDPARRAGSARAGHAQAAAEVDRIAPVWTDTSGT